MKPINNHLFFSEGKARFFEKILPESVEIFSKTGGPDLAVRGQKITLFIGFIFCAFLAFADCKGKGMGIG